MENKIKEIEEKLLRKEQECEELKKSVEHWQMEHKASKAKAEWTYDLVKKRLGKQLDQLKAENEKLKKQRQADKGLITSTGKMNYQLIQEHDKLENCLAEIKEIAEKDFRHTAWEEYAKQLKQILQKISEVEDA